MILDLIITFICTLFGTCSDGSCTEVRHNNADYVICSYNTSAIDVRLFLNDEQDRPYGRFSRLPTRDHSPALMLMNGGMYHDDLAAVGLYIEDGIEKKSISTKGGWGNFHLLPNGVFWGKDGKLGVTETKAFIKSKIKPDFATQSGPMLVIDGKLHPRFLVDSTSRKIRNGVGISKDGGTIHFALSRGSVTFWDFGKLFQEHLETPNALFLDGTISAIKADGFSQGGWRELGPIIGVFRKASG